MAVLCKQFQSVAQGDTAPDAFCQLPSLDVVHFARLTILEDDTLAAQPQPTIILLEKQAQMEGYNAQVYRAQTVPPNTYPGLARYRCGTNSCRGESQKEETSNQEIWMLTPNAGIQNPCESSVSALGTEPDKWSLSSSDPGIPIQSVFELRWLRLTIFQLDGSVKMIHVQQKPLSEF